MTTVLETLELPDGIGASQCVISIRLAGSDGAPVLGYGPGGQVVSEVVIIRPAGGSYSVELTGTSNITPENTRYRRSLSAPGFTDVDYWNVPASGTHNAADILSVAPDTIGEGIAGPVGPQGPPGEQGETGPAGPQGDPGLGTPTEHDVPIARGERVDIEVVDGKFTHHNFVFTNEVLDPDKVAIAVLHNPELADESERVTFKSADDAPPASIVWVDHLTTPAVMDLSSLFGAIIGAVGGSGTIDLTTATLGHPFISKAVVDGDIVESAPIDASFVIDSGDGYAGVVALITALAQPFVALGAEFVMEFGTVTSPTMGSGSSLGFDPSQEAIGSVDLTDPGIVPVAPGLDTDRVCGAADGREGGLNADQWFDPDEYLIVGNGTHNHPNDAMPHQRTAVLAPVHAVNNGGQAKFTAVKWPIRDGFIHVTVRDPDMWAGSPPHWLNEQVERVALGLTAGLDGGLIPQLPG